MRPTAVLITRDAAGTLARCLESLDFVEEIVVLDHGSTDATREICARHGARVIEAEWAGFGPAKRAVTAAAHTRWVLSLDADETVSPELRDAILALPDAPEPAAYAVNRLSRFLGRWMRHSGWHPDWIVRLFDRERADFDDSPVHERVEVRGPIARLDGLLMHYAYEDLDQWIEKQNRYGTLAAETAAAAGARGSLGRAVLRGHFAFLRTYLLRGGWRDGAHGLALCLLTGGATFQKHLKIWHATRGRKDG